MKDLTEKKEVSVDELDSVAGGVPELDVTISGSLQLDLERKDSDEIFTADGLPRLKL